MDEPQSGSGCPSGASKRLMSDSPREALLDLVRDLAAQVAWQRDLDLVDLPLRGALPAPRPDEAVGPVAVPLAVVESPAPVAVIESPAAVEAVEPPAAVEAVEAPAPVVQAPPVLVPAAGPGRARDKALPPVLRALWEDSPEPVLLEIPAQIVGPRRVEALRAVQDEVAACTRCRLAAGRTQTVFARGNPFARVVFVGEAPGQQEDEQGLPFVGRAGQLLDRIIMSMGLSPATDVYIANIAKCRPPSNRNPFPDEMDACGPFLLRQLGMIRPEVIVVLGKVAAHYLLQVDGPMGKLRGQWASWQGIAVMPTWHPSYVLREAERPGSTARREVWTDVQLVMQRLGLPRPTP